MWFLAAALTASFAGTAFAHPHNTSTRGIDRREMRQNMRIRAGVRQGDLARREAIRLRMRQRHIHRMETRSRADGRITRRERYRMHRALDREGRAVYRLRNNPRRSI
jgi:hypothetical protein